MNKKKAKRYCAVYNCLNKDCDPNLAFFKFPKDVKRCRQWLTLIDRLDLLQKKDTKMGSFLVCSDHFEDSSLKIIKHLKNNALPSIRLPNQSQDTISCSEIPSTSSQDIGKLIKLSDENIKKDITCSKLQSEVQFTENIKGNDKNMLILSKSKGYATVATQTETSNSLATAETQRKRKRSNEICEYTLHEQKLDQEITEIKKELEN